MIVVVAHLLLSCYFYFLSIHILYIYIYSSLILNKNSFLKYQLYLCELLGQRRLYLKLRRSFCDLTFILILWLILDSFLYKQFLIRF